MRHTTPSTQNFQPSKPLPTHPRERERLATVCKHWLRGLCKKGDQCEFLHEYNLRRMPECWWYAKYGYCSAGDECLYAHPKERRVECPDYNRGFCKLGESTLRCNPRNMRLNHATRTGMSAETRTSRGMPKLPNRFLSSWSRMPPWPVSYRIPTPAHFLIVCQSQTGPPTLEGLRPARTTYATRLGTSAAWVRQICGL